MTHSTTHARPNVIVFLTDQQRWDASALHGNPLDLMPAFDRLAHGGTHIAHSITTQPVCAPARSTLQLGRYATETGVWKNGLNPDLTVPTLAGTFAGAGYETAYVGKWHLYDHGEGEPGPVPQSHRLGYRHWLASNILEFTSDAYQTRLFDEEGAAVDLHGYRVDACVDAAIGMVNRLADGPDPFFLFVSLIEPHHQNSRDDYPAPIGNRGRYAGRWTPPDLQALGGTSAMHLDGYWGMIRRIDDAFDRMMDVLVSRDIANDTVVLFTSDHGNHFKTRNGEYKRSPHDVSIRVPTMLTGGPFTGGGMVRQIVSHIDIPPTLLDACGIPIPETFRGKSIVPLVRDQAARDSWPDEAYIQISESETGRALRTPRWLYGVRDTKSVGTDLAFERGWSATMEEGYLYDCASDPYQLDNLVTRESHRGVCDHLRSRLLTRMEEAGEQRCQITPPPSIEPSGQRQVTDPR